jgi:2-oxoglutarate dehydrogenase E1 component
MNDLDRLLAGSVYLDSLYRDYERDPDSVGAEWAALFERFDQGEMRERPRTPVILTPTGRLPDNLPRDSISAGIQIYDLVHCFREFGHLVARLDPLGLSDATDHPFLELGQFGFSSSDLDTEVRCHGFHGLDRASVREHIDVLRETYCGPIGVEYMDLDEAEQRDWLQRRMEPVRNRPRLTDTQKKKLLNWTIRADGFEENLHRMYPGTKRFSLEGGTTLITLLQTLIEEAAEDEVEQVVMGMAHRGRLNVLAHVMQKPLEYILAEFEGRPLAAEIQGYGDVKYHMGYSSDYVHNDGRHVHLSMAFNPSHLETVNPVVAGIVRAKQDQLADRERRKVVPVLIHGDAAFAGQGVVAETLLLGGLAGYETGGTVHIIVNNQVGFTADPEETRSTRYASDIAKSIRVPVFHVNADHPEAVHLVAQIALGYRQHFRRDVVIDLICFRRHGHNELDDASFTQPIMAQRIREHPAVSSIYAEKLVKGEVLEPDEIEAMKSGYRDEMQRARESARALPAQVTQRFGGAWKGLAAAGADWSVETAVERPRLEEVATALTRVPEGWSWHPRLRRIIDQRQKSVLEDRGLDWGTAEALALGALLVEGTSVRLSGQDSGRGTFGHRHAIYADMQSGARYLPLAHLAEGQGRLEVINSPLSEEAVLGFEYGYSSADPWTLVIWEAQFGDFVNGAQVIIDQLIASAEYKWGRMSGLVLLLPHGYEGQGPEHSSARLERFLELCAENNMQVCNFTTPAQYFHALRRQIHLEFRKPLVVMSPKSLLRHPAAVSRVADLAEGRFSPVLDDPDQGDGAGRQAVRRVLLCSGKIAHALMEQRRELGRDDVAVVRLEQLYPYPLAEVREILSAYSNLECLIWVQEEPRNMGAWRNLLHRFQASVSDGARLEYAGRDSRAVPATGSHEVHQAEEAAILEAAFSGEARDHVIRRLDRDQPRQARG